MSTLLIGRWPLSAVICLLLSSIGFLSPSYAASGKEGVEAANTLTLPQALARVLRDNPSLQSYPYYLRADEARTLQARQRPAPQLSLELDNVAGSGALDGGEQLEATLALSQVIEMGDKRDKRRQLSEWRMRGRQSDYELARLDTLAEASTQYLRVVLAQYQKQFAQQQSAWANSAAAAAQRRLQAGSISAAEAGQARAEAMRAELDIEQAKTQLQAQRRQLATYWGSTEIDFGRVSADLFQLPELPSFDELEQQLAQSPQWQSWLNKRRLREAELALEQAQSSQDIELGIGVKHQRASGDNGLNLSLSLPLGTEKRNRGAVRAARTELDAINTEQLSNTVEITAQLNIAWNQLLNTKRRLSTLREQILPELQGVEEQFRKAYQRGRFTYINLLEARQQRLAIESEVLNTAFEFHSTLIQLERLTGAPLTERSLSTVQENTP